MFLDVQVGQGTLQEELPRLMPFLSRPDVHLAIDPEFSMKHNDVPGTRIGTFNAEDVNYASGLLRDLVTQLRLPPKILIVHRFTRDMLTGYKRIALDPRVQIVINMDGWGPPALKRESYRAYVYSYPVEYEFKLFYHNIPKRRAALMTPADVLALAPSRYTSIPVSAVVHQLITPEEAHLCRLLDRGVVLPQRLSARCCWQDAEEEAAMAAPRRPLRRFPSRSRRRH
jgi:hypothetical protein